MANDSSAPHAMKPYLLMEGEGVAGFNKSVKAARVSTAGHLTMIECFAPKRACVSKPEPGAIDIRLLTEPGAGKSPACEPHLMIRPFHP